MDNTIKVAIPGVTCIDDNTKIISSVNMDGLVELYLISGSTRMGIHDYTNKIDTMLNYINNLLKLNGINKQLEVGVSDSYVHMMIANSELYRFCERIRFIYIFITMT